MSESNAAGGTVDSRTGADEMSDTLAPPKAVR